MDYSKEIAAKREDAAGLEHDPHPVDQSPVVPDRVQSQDAGPPAGRRSEPLEVLDGRGLARTVGTQQHGDLAATGHERHTVDGSHRAVVDPEVLDLDDGVGHVRKLPPSTSAHTSSGWVASSSAPAMRSSSTPPYPQVAPMQWRPWAAAPSTS